jgi:hypothetical protein
MRSSSLLISRLRLFRWIICQAKTLIELIHNIQHRNAVAKKLVHQFPSKSEYTQFTNVPLRKELAATGLNPPNRYNIQLPSTER